MNAAGEKKAHARKRSKVLNAKEGEFMRGTGMEDDGENATEQSAQIRMKGESKRKGDENERRRGRRGGTHVQSEGQ